MNAAAGIAERLAAVRGRCDAAARAAGRDPASVRIVAVSKRMPADAVAAAWQAGQRDFGENYLQEATAKIEATREALAGVRWHFIGRLQSNKAAAVARSFAMVHGVDSLRAAAALAKAARSEGRVLDVLLQVRLGRRGAPVSSAGSDQGGAPGARIPAAPEASGTDAPGRGGVEADEAEAFLRAAAAPGALRFAGLMGVADPDEEARPQFAALARLSARLGALGIEGAPLGELSMGMTADLEDAVAEGATIVRIGTAIFGERQDA